MTSNLFNEIDLNQWFLVARLAVTPPVEMHR